MIIKRFFKVHSNEIVIFKVNFNSKYEKFRVFVTFYIPGSGAGAGPKKFRLRLQQKVAAPPAPAPQHCFFQARNLFLGNNFLWVHFVTKVSLHF
jgi:hypothetical protein